MLLNSTIMLVIVLHYASICSYASVLLLCSKLCWHTSPRPTTVAVHLFQRQFIQYLIKQFSSLPRKIYYTSDGAASQYKNRKIFINLCHHEEDFGVAAEWHFSATSHGKGTCDGVGGTVKRLAARASLQRPYDQQIMTPRQLFEWAVNNIPAIAFQ